MPFAPSIAILSLVQAGLIALPGNLGLPALSRLRSRWLALVLPGSVVVVISAIAADPGTATALTYLALAVVPPLAALALARAIRGARSQLAAAAIPLFLIACGPLGSLPAQVAALALTGLACVALGCLCAATVPSRWLKVGIYAMALIDTCLVAADLLQGPNATLNAAAPAGGLPQLQFAQCGSAQIGFGDLFIAAVLGALLASRRPSQVRAAVLAAAFALLFDLLFLLVSELPATVPVALTLASVELSSRRRLRRTESGARREHGASLGRSPIPRSGSSSAAEGGSPAR